MDITPQHQQQHQLATAAADHGPAQSDSVISIMDSSDADEAARRDARPKRRSKGPARFTPAKYPPTRRPRGLKKQEEAAPITKRKPGRPRKHPQVQDQQQQQQQRKGSAGRHEERSFAPLPVQLTSAAAAAAAAVAAAGEEVPAAAAGGAAGPEADLATATLGLQPAQLYGQLLTQVQALLDGLHPCQELVQLKDLMQELTTFAEQRQHLQQMEQSLQSVMATILQKLPRDMQKQARLLLLPYSKQPDSPAAAGGPGMAG